jgi:hypothetical protein
MESMINSYKQPESTEASTDPTKPRLGLLDGISSLNGINEFPICLVTIQAKDMIEECINLLEDACPLSLYWYIACSNLTCVMILIYFNSSTTLYRTVRDVLEMYYHLMPVCHEQCLSSDPEKAALFHNDCMYIAYKLLCIGPQFIGRLHVSGAGSPKLSDDDVSFLDLVPFIQNAGIKSLNIFLV